MNQPDSDVVFTPEAVNTIELTILKIIQRQKRPGRLLYKAIDRNRGGK